MNIGPKILVIRGGAIGDFVLTLPVFSALRERFFQAHLAVLGYPHITGLARAGGLVDEVKSIDSRSLATFFVENGPLNDDWCVYFAGFPLIISYLYDPDEIFRTNIKRVSNAQFIQGAHRPNEHGKMHATDVFLQALERLAIFSPDPVPRLALSKTSGAVAEAFDQTKRRLAVHPGSGSEMKNWPEQRWKEFLDWIVSRTNVNCLLVGGEAEGERLRRLAAGMPADRLALSQSLPLPQLAGQLASCGGFIGHDSGISHLAGALGLAGLVLWGDTIEAVWRPRSDRVTLVREASGLKNLTVDRVIQEFQKHWIAP